ncbi:MAG: cobalamin B12-binding domain-containing protein [Limnohabitans sp.]|jgi:methanogenic corrinoid protein MtbC1|nr:cobalamin B12-binding domain-containing protein [Limnohabitans sp.]
MNTNFDNNGGFDNAHDLLNAHATHTMHSTNSTKSTKSSTNTKTAKAPNFERVSEQLFSALVSGDRRASREIVDAVYNAGIPAETIAKDIYWPLLESISTMYRKDQMTTLAHHYATRLLRMLVDQAQARFTQQTQRGQRIAMFCGPNETEELAGQLVADLLEADGYEVTFAGGGVANDEIRSELGERNAETLLIFASSAKDAPFIRELIDNVRGSGAFDHLQIVVGGGVFNRAPGLAEEIGADVSASSPRDLLEKLVSDRTTRNERWVKTTRRARSAA